MYLKSVKDKEGAEFVLFREVVRSLVIANQKALPDIANTVIAAARHSHESKEIP